MTLTFLSLADAVKYTTDVIQRPKTLKAASGLKKDFSSRTIMTLGTKPEKGVLNAVSRKRRKEHRFFNSDNFLQSN